MASRYRGSEAEQRGLDAFVKLLRASEAVVRRVGGGPLGPGRLPVLEALWFLGPMSQVELARKLLRSPSNMTALIDALEAAGLVARARRTEDRRVVEVSLTDAGRAAIEAAFPEHARNVVEAMSGLTADEQVLLAALCKKLGLAASPPTPSKGEEDAE